MESVHKKPPNLEVDFSMSYPRERTSIATRSGGTCGRFTWWPTDGPGVEVNSSLNFARDTIGPDDLYPLDFDRQELSGGTMNQAYAGYYSSWFSNWVPEILRSGFNISHLATGTSLLDSYYATQIAARTNPSRPYVDLPREIAELRDLAQFFKTGSQDRNFLPGLDRRTPGEFGRGYLGYQFGVAPIGRFIASLATAHDAITKRASEIRRLVATGINRTMTLDFGSASSREYRYIDTAHSTCGGYFDTTTIEEVRAHIRWGLYPSALEGVTSPGARDAQIQQWARDAVYGRTIDASTLYQLHPYTWLIDWGVSMGDYFRATRNIVPALIKEIAVMRHRKTVSSYPGETFDPGGGAKNISIAPIRMTRESKMRRFSFISPLNVHIPFIDKGRAQIIASLAAARH